MNWIENMHRDGWLDLGFGIWDFKGFLHNLDGSRPGRYYLFSLMTSIENTKSWAVIQQRSIIVSQPFPQRLVRATPEVITWFLAVYSSCIWVVEFLALFGKVVITFQQIFLSQVVPYWLWYHGLEMAEEVGLSSPGGKKSWFHFKQVVQGRKVWNHMILVLNKLFDISHWLLGW